MNLLEKIAENTGHINGIPLERVKRIAASRSMSQEQFAEFVGVSVSNLRQRLKKNKIVWRNNKGRIIKRKLKDNSRINDKINTAYYNPGINSRIKPSFGSGFYNVR